MVKSFTEQVNFRLFSEELENAIKIVNHAKDKDGNRKYENLSHFWRCSIMAKINEENRLLEIKPGRPQEYRNGRYEDETS